MGSTLLWRGLPRLLGLQGARCLATGANKEGFAGIKGLLQPTDWQRLAGDAAAK